MNRRRSGLRGFTPLFPCGKLSQADSSCNKTTHPLSATTTKNPTAKFRALKIPRQPNSKVSAVRSDKTDKKLPELLLDTKKPCSDAGDTFGLFRVRLEKQRKEAGGSNNTYTHTHTQGPPQSHTQCVFRASEISCYKAIKKKKKVQGGVWKISAAVDPGKPPNLHVRREGRGGGFCPAPSTTPIMVTITDICHNQYLLLRVVATRGGSVLCFDTAISFLLLLLSFFSC